MHFKVPAAHAMWHSDCMWHVARAPPIPSMGGSHLVQINFKLHIRCGLAIHQRVAASN